MSDIPASTDSDSITCSATPWYLWQRVVPFSIIPLLMAAWFYYDYKVGYPEKLVQYETSVSYQKEHGPIEWKKYAAERGWEQDPDHIDQDKVDGQLHWAIGAGLLGVISALYHILSYPKKLRANATSFTPPWGAEIPFSKVVKIDRRPWKLKGLAKVYYRSNDKLKKANLDDLRFKGADLILDRLQANFTGEILELEDEQPATDPTTASAASSLPKAPEAGAES